MTTVHATCVTFGGQGVLIRGASGAGKSALAHMILMRAPVYGLEAKLVADDRVALTEESGALIARPAEALAGLLEVRGLGIVRFPHLAEMRVDLVLDLLPEAEIARLPAFEEAKACLNGVTLPRVAANSPERGLDVLLTINGQSGATFGYDVALASVTFDGKTKRP